MYCMHVLYVSQLLTKLPSCFVEDKSIQCMVVVLLCFYMDEEYDYCISISWVLLMMMADL